MPTFEVRARGARPVRVPALDAERAIDRGVRRLVIRDCPEIAGALPRPRFCEFAADLAKRYDATAVRVPS